MENSTKIIKRLQDKGHEAYLVGGCVRDMILKRDNHDEDIATSATPDEIQRLFSASNFVGNSFGVSLVEMGTETFEVATFRSDSSYSNGRHPDEVVYTRDLKEDAIRRDLTMNAVYYDPIREIFIDPVRGIEDIKDKIIRFIGDPEQRINEDNLRILRAIRFKSILGFKFDAVTRNSIVRNIDKITSVSKERFRDELFKMLEGCFPSVWVNELNHVGALPLIPGFMLMSKTPQNPVWHPEGDVLVHACQVADYLYEHDKDSITVLAGLLHDLGKTVTTKFEAGRITSKGHAKESARLIREWGTYFRIPKKDIEMMAEVGYDHMSLHHPEKMKKSTLKRYFNKPHAEMLLDVVEADCSSPSKSQGHDFNPGVLLKKMKEEFVEKGSCNPDPFIKGKDLINRGLQPGPEFKVVLEKIRDKQLDGFLENREEALEYLNSIIAKRRNEI